MTGGPQFDEVFDVLHQRATLLARLHDGPVAKPALVEALDVSRSTVDRAVEALEAHELAVRRNGGVEITMSGRLLYDAYEAFRERGANVVRARTLLNHLDADVEFDAAVLTDAVVLTADQPAPFLPAREARRLLDTAVRMEGFSESVLNFGAAERLHTAVTEGTLEYECVYTSGMLSHLERNWSEERRRMAQTGQYRMFESPRPSFPFDLFVVDDDAGETYVLLIVYDDERIFRGILRTEDDEAVEWARSVIAEYRQAATDVTDRFRQRENT